MVTRNPEFVLKWADALESGEYKQGRERLRNYDEELCCLGVACEISRYRRLKADDGYEYEHPDAIAPLTLFEHPTYECSGYIMPSPRMLRDFGISNDEAEDLATMNDNGDTFVEIASKLREWVDEWSNPNGH